MLLCVIFGLHTTHRNNTKDISDQGEPWCKNGSGGADGQGSKPSHLGDQQNAKHPHHHCPDRHHHRPHHRHQYNHHLWAQHGSVSSPLCKNVSNVEQSWPWTIIWKRGSLYDSKHKVRFIQEVAAVIISLERFDLVVHLHLENWPDLQWLHRSKI